MLPARADAVPVPYFSPPGSAQRASPDVQPPIVLAVPAADVSRFACSGFAVYAVHTTDAALRCLETTQPRVVAVDCDTPSLDGPRICTAARGWSQTGVLITTGSPERVPGALRAGCHAVLLKPFAPNLVAARVGRLCREMSDASRMADGSGRLPHCGTNRVWPDTVCPHCREAGAVSFEFASYRRMWYACLACDWVWLAARQE